MNNPAPPVGGSGMVSIGVAVTLIAAGGILRFTVATTSTHGLNVHVVGVIVILAGLLGLVLSLLVWGPLNPRRNRTADDGRAAPPLTPQRFPQDQPPATVTTPAAGAVPPPRTPGPTPPRPPPVPAAPQDGSRASGGGIAPPGAATGSVAARGINRREAPAMPAQLTPLSDRGDYPNAC